MTYMYRFIIDEKKNHPTKYSTYLRHGHQMIVWRCDCRNVFRTLELECSARGLKIMQTHRRFGNWSSQEGRRIPEKFGSCSQNLSMQPFLRVPKTGKRLRIRFERDFAPLRSIRQWSLYIFTFSFYTWQSNVCSQRTLLPTWKSLNCPKTRFR
jgi:hypothetical protein